MKKNWALLLSIALFMGCNADPKSQSDTSLDGSNSEQTSSVDTKMLKTDIESLINFFAAQSGKSLNKEKASEMIRKSAQFATAFPDDPKASGYLFMSGEVARSIGRYEDAINIFSKVEKDYVDHEKAPSALFLKAFTYEENLNDTALAKKHYNEFLEKYPNHQLAKEVKQLLAVIDVSPEELIKRFQQQNQQ
ncbi:MAG: tol-pal system YbgF family protein [Saprospiraceae bacterium]